MPKLERVGDRPNNWGDRWLAFRFRCLLRVTGILLYDCHWLISGSREYDTHCADLHSTNSSSRAPRLLASFHRNIVSDNPEPMPGFKVMSPQEMLDVFGTADTQEAIKRMRGRTSTAGSTRDMREPEIEPEAADYPRNPKSPWGQ